MEKIRINLTKIDELKKKNIKDRLWFVRYWANYVRTHPDKEWGGQQKVLIDSALKVAKK